MASATRAAIELVGKDATGPAFKSVESKFRGLEKQIGGIGRGFQAAQSALLAGVGGLAGVSLAQQAIEAADAYANITARLKLASSGTEEFARAQREVFAIAQRSGSALASTADLYGSLSRNAASLGASQADLLRVTETINKAFQVSGASSASASAAITQLSQAFASGVLRGDELNSVLEQAPRLAQAIAQGLGVTVGQLRQLGQEGKLTAAEVFGALRQAGAQIDQEFAQLPDTVERASQRMGNSILRLVGQIDRLTGATASLARSGNSIAQTLDGLSAALQRGERDVRGYVDAWLILARNSPGLTGALLLLRRALPEVPALPTPVRGGSSDPRQGRGFVSPEDKAQQEERLKFAEKFATRQEKLNAALEKYRKLLGSSFSADDERRIREAFAERANPRGNLGNAIADAEAQIFQRFEEYRERNQAALDEWEASDNAIAAAEAEVFQRIQAAREAADDALVRAGAASFDATRTPLERLNIELARQQELLDALGPSYRDTYERAVFAAQDAFEEASKLADKMQETDGFARDVGLTFSSAFEDAIVEGKKLRDVLKGIAQDLFRIIIRKQITEPLGNAITAALPSLFGGAGRASGGTVKRGGLYPVNEYGGAGEILQAGGRQYLMAAQDGYVTPASSRLPQFAAAGVTNNITIQTPPGMRAEATERRNDSGGIDTLVRILDERMAAGVLAGNSRTARAMQGTYGLSRAAGAPRRA